MGFYQSRFGRFKPEVEEAMVKRLAFLFYDDLIKERRFVEDILRDYDKAIREEKIPPSISKEEVALLVRAYKKAIALKEKEMLVKAITKEPKPEPVKKAFKWREEE